MEIAIWQFGIQNHSGGQKVKGTMYDQPEVSLVIHAHNVNRSIKIARLDKRASHDNVSSALLFFGAQQSGSLVARLGSCACKVICSTETVAPLLGWIHKVESD